MFDASPRPELLALLAAVKAEPDDDTPKLVLADWLQEQDDEHERARGEWLRELVRYDRLDAHDPARSDVSLLNHLARKHGRAWFGRLEAVGFRHCHYFAFNRWGTYSSVT